uniref:nucleolar and coiled-body phosphoprotein 1-like n=1 Tax=Styela clava TaxID=7725 RepID=UPI0019397BCB|nr:nucleolar and coiled-body phosphoprotein 1-like [Styela clava]
MDVLDSELDSFVHRYLIQRNLVKLAKQFGDESKSKPADVKKATVTDFYQTWIDKRRGVVSESKLSPAPKQTKTKIKKSNAVPANKSSDSTSKSNNSAAKQNVNGNKSSSSSEESSSDDEEEEKVDVIKDKTVSNGKASNAKDSSSSEESSSGDSSSDEEEDAKKAVAKESVAQLENNVDLKTNISTAKQNHDNGKSSSSSEESSSEEEEEKVDTKDSKAVLTTKADDSSSSSEESSSEDEEDSAPPKKIAKIDADIVTKLNSSASKKKMAKQESSSSSSEESSEEEDDSSKKVTKKDVNNNNKTAELKQVMPADSYFNGTPKTPLQNNINTSKSSGKKSNKSTPNTPFRRVKDEDFEIDHKFSDNSFGSKRDSWGEAAHNILKHTKGKSFRREKTKMKRGHYRGGSINMEVCSIQFDSD